MLYHQQTYNHVKKKGTSRQNTHGIHITRAALPPAVEEKVRKVSQIVQLSSKVVFQKYVQKEKDAQIGKTVYEALRIMGPTYVKIGQFISTRSDIFGKDFTKELASLQDQVLPMDKGITLKIIEDIKEQHPGVFALIDETPIAAASIGQVHYGRLQTGEEIVVKMKRVGIETTIKEDFGMLLGLISFIKLFSQHRQVQEVEISLRQYYDLLMEEIDFTKEVSNMTRFTQQFASTKWLKIPYPYTMYSSNDIIVMEYVPSIKIDDIAAIEKANLRRDVISQKLLECFFTQIVQYGFVHIDPHPGNVGINPTTGKLVFYDYGMFVELNGIMKDTLKQLFIAMYDRDIDEVCDILIRYDIIQLEEERAPYFKKFVASFLVYLDNLDINDFKVSYLDRIDQSEMQFLISSKFVLLLRGISIMEGNCKRLDPNFNYRSVLDPFINDFIMDISYFERRGTKDIQRFTQTPDRVVSSEISLSMVEKDIATLKKKQTTEISKQRTAVMVLCGLLLLQTDTHSVANSLAQAAGIVAFLYMYSSDGKSAK
jgi:predicted unusual protein kinase regulating ubiquinone biosynthesis (AarF/ABC1/UbiB family)